MTDNRSEYWIVDKFDQLNDISGPYYTYEEAVYAFNRHKEDELPVLLVQVLYNFIGTNTLKDSEDDD